MSMKRTKAVSRRGKDNDGPSFGKKGEEPKFDWDEHVASAPEAHFLPYALSTKFERSQLLDHSKFGRGIVTAVDGARIEVLFKEGPKKLGHAQQ